VAPVPRRPAGPRDRDHLGRADLGAARRTSSASPHSRRLACPAGSQPPADTPSAMTRPAGATARTPPGGLSALQRVLDAACGPAFDGYVTASSLWRPSTRLVHRAPGDL